MPRISIRLTISAVAMILAAAACTGGASEGPSGPAATAEPSPAGSIAGGGSGGGANGFEGTLTTSGFYDATWSVGPDQIAEPFNAYGARTLAADTGAFGNVSVMPDGSVSFGSGAPEFSSHGLQLSGTGAQVTLDATGAFVCAFNVDIDLTVADGAKLHLAGSMTVHWEGGGDLRCP